MATMFPPLQLLQRNLFLHMHRRLSTSQIVRPDLRGRDLINGDMTPGELKTILWTATDIRHRVTEAKENFSYMKGKSVTILHELSATDTLNSVAMATAAHRLGGNVAKMAVDFDQIDASDLANSLSGMSDVIAVSCGRQAAVQAVADGAAVPVVCLGSQRHDPVTVLAELLALLDHYSYLKRLTLSWVGPARARLYTYLQMMPSLGIHLRYCCPQDEDLDEDEFGALVRRTVRRNTQFSRHDSAADATYRAHVLTTTSHGHEHLRIGEQHTAEADLNWTFVQDLPRGPAAVSPAVFGARPRSLVATAAGCRPWLAAGLLAELCNQHERRTDRPDFEGDR